MVSYPMHSTAFPSDTADMKLHIQFPKISSGHGSHLSGNVSALRIDSTNFMHALSVFLSVSMFIVVILSKSDCCNTGRYQWLYISANMISITLPSSASFCLQTLPWSSQAVTLVIVKFQLNSPFLQLTLPSSPHAVTLIIVNFHC